MYPTQPIRNPFGVSVFGSTIIRVEPDMASLYFSVTGTKEHPKEAFEKTHERAKQVRIYLKRAGIDEVNSSRITLSQSYRFEKGENIFEGYKARIAFHVSLRDLDQMENLLVGVVDAGAHDIDTVELQTSKLKAYRTEARQRAILAAREKAEIYCRAAGVELGSVIHIEDANPDHLRGQESHVRREIKPDDDGPISVFDPGSIIVGAAVRVAFNLK